MGRLESSHSLWNMYDILPNKKSCKMVSYIPQYRAIQKPSASSNVSLIYILFNTLSALEQFTILVEHAMFPSEVLTGVMHNPPTTGDWLNIAQVTVVLVMSLALFIKCIRCLPTTEPKAASLAILTQFVLITVVPLATQACFQWANPKAHEGMTATIVCMFLTMHGFVVNPLVSAGVVWSYSWARAAQRQRPPRPGLSRRTLWMQALVFALVGFSWAGRLTVNSSGMKPVTAWIYWYQTAGWATVNNLLFAFVQGGLFFHALKEHRAAGAELTEDKIGLLSVASVESV
ncbi:hypothetical protein G7054_g6729 [Neopestalotiopsis clavispora]|nr:hypothetical protein G7054_g6729 [Neopestalotiopsis clavispora]